MTRALITGAASGIGLATAEELLQRGWEVVGVDRVKCPRPDVVSVLADVTDPDRLAEAGQSLGGVVDAIVCAAGIWDTEADGNPERLDLAVWEKTLAVNLTGTMLTLRAFAGELVDDGAIVTLGSVAALAGMPRRDAYTATKGAIAALTRSWAIDYSRRGVRVNCVCPGPTRTPMISDLLDSLEEERLIGLPQQRPAEPAEIAAVIAFLVSPDSSYLSGQVIAVDGGATAGLAGLPFPKRR